jgi:hypothetical protein
MRVARSAAGRSRLSENSNPLPPLNLDEARRKATQIQRERSKAMDTYIDQVQRAADAEHAYRIELSKKIVALKTSWPATVCQDMARGDEAVAALARERDIEKGLIKADLERLEQLESDRAMLRHFSERSERSGIAA